MTVIHFSNPSSQLLEPLSDAIPCLFLVQIMSDKLTANQGGGLRKSPRHQDVMASGLARLTVSLATCPQVDKMVRIP